jgi:hypothetical protein
VATDIANGQVLPRTTVAVRGGTMPRERLIESAETEFERTLKEAGTGAHGLSVSTFVGLSAREIALRVGTDALPHSKFRASTVGVLRDYGFEVVPTPIFGAGHATLRLPTPPADADFDKLDAAFSTAECNPVRRPKGA